MDNWERRGRRKRVNTKKRSNGDARRFALRTAASPNPVGRATRGRGSSEASITSILIDRVMLVIGASLDSLAGP
jgi:hypothetical protein